MNRTSYKWVKFSLCERMQYTMIKESEPSLKTASHGVPQSSVLGPHLFTLSSSSATCTIQLNVVKYITMWMTQICYWQITLSKKRQVNHDLSLLCHWLMAKK